MIRIKKNYTLDNFGTGKGKIPDFVQNRNLSIENVTA